MMRGVLSALVSSVLLASAAHAQAEPTEMLSGLYAGKRNQDTIHLEIRGDSLVLLQPKAVGIGRLSEFELSSSDPKGQAFEWRASLFILSTLERSGVSSQVPTRDAEMRVSLGWVPKSKTLTLCMTPGRHATNPRAPSALKAAEAKAASKGREQCTTFTRVSGHNESVPPVPAKEAAQPAVDHECQRACRTNIRGKDADKRIKACEASCQRP